MTPSPDPFDVFVQAGPAEWWEVLAALGPLAVLLAAVLGAAISLRTLTAVASKRPRPSPDAAKPHATSR